jgi:hypothetical protein
MTLACLLTSVVSLSACTGDTIPALSGSARPLPGLNAEEQRLFDQIATASTAAGCGRVQTVPPFSPEGLDRAHIGGPDMPTAPPLASYPSVPAASGPHNPVPLGAGVYADPPPVDRTIHSLEHAAVVIWYSPVGASDTRQADELALLQTFFDKPTERTKVIVAPYDYPTQGSAGVLPSPVTMALVAWHHVQQCQRISLPVAFNFVVHYRFPPPDGAKYLGSAPETTVPIG